MNPIIQSPLRKLKLLLILPVFAGILYAFAVPEYKNLTVTEAQNDSIQETKIVVGNITWEGNSVYTSDELNQALDIQKGNIYSQKQIDQQLYYGHVSDLYFNNGYLFFNLESVPTKKADGTTDFTFKIFEGGQYKIRNVEVKGNEKVSQKDILAICSIKSGDLFSKEKLIQSYNDLVETGKFVPEEIVPDVKPDLSTQSFTFGAVDIVFTVVEK